MHKLAIFIDGAYLSNVFEKQFDGHEINYEALPGWISAQFGLTKSDVMRTYYYDCLSLNIDENFIKRNKPRGEYCESCLVQVSANKVREKRELLERLENLPRFDVRLGRLGFRGWKKWKPENENCIHNFNKRSPYLRQKGVDLLIAVDLVHFASTQRISVAALLAGDADFVPAVEVVKMHGLVVKLVHGGKENPPHTDLLRACDERIEIDSSVVPHISIPPFSN